MATLEELDRELEEARAAADEQLRSAQRATADLANYRRRVEEDRGASMGFAIALLIGKLLAVLDDFDLALDHVPPDAHEGWLDGIRLVERNVRSLLEAEGVTQIEAAGQLYDPDLH